jgi:hypothetical protein
MERDQQNAGDYGYDLAHEETGGVPTQNDTTVDPHGSASEPPGTGEPAADLGYDEAHDF